MQKRGANPREISSGPWRLPDDYGSMANVRVGRRPKESLDHLTFVYWTGSHLQFLWPLLPDPVSLSLERRSAWALPGGNTHRNTWDRQGLDLEVLFRDTGCVWIYTSQMVDAVYLFFCFHMALSDLCGKSEEERTTILRGTVRQ